MSQILKYVKTYISAKFEQIFLCCFSATCVKKKFDSGTAINYSATFQQNSGIFCYLAIVAGDKRCLPAMIGASSHMTWEHIVCCPVSSVQ